MAKSAPGRGKRASESADPIGNATKDRLADLDARLGALRGKRPGAGDEPPNARVAAIGAAMRMGLELVLGTVVGGFIGWQLDRWLGTGPFLLLIFFVLGVVAGILNVVRTAYEIQSPPDRTPKD